MNGFVYMMSNKPDGALYVGVTNHLARRVYEHKEGKIEGHTKKYGLDKLVYFEEASTMPEAIEKEKQLKSWKRAWKVRLILEQNAAWEDLYETLI